MGKKMGSIAIGLVQMRMSDEPERNLGKAIALIKKAAGKGADIVCIPELFMTPYFPREPPTKVAFPKTYFETLPGLASNALSKAARECGVSIIGGSVFEKAGRELYNTSMVFDERGRMLGSYRKMHVPQDEYFFEKEYFSPGNRGFSVFKTRNAAIGALICYDQWFPEAARILALKGAQIIFYPTAIGTVRGVSQSEGNWHAAWENVMRGHAIANNVVVAAANRAGNEGKTTFWGGSFICDAFGKTLGRMGRNEGVLVRQISLDHGRQIREGWKFFQNRRPIDYSQLVKW